MHKMTDKLPTTAENNWQLEHSRNATATQAQYVPYSTVKPKIEAWTP
jgi:NADH dehydrogenase (ubiquinone) 1 alpha subcomplex subunit 12/NADH dehydrogenase [ubiquinone] 1 alpha subcomplex assembly factor 2